MIKEKPILKNVLLITLCALLIICSICFGSHTASNPETYKKTIAELNEKSADVAKMSVATLGMSTLIAAVPGDTTTPIADYLVDLNSWLLIIMMVLTLEKYLLTIIGKAVFWLIIPIGLALIGISIPPKSRSLKIRGLNILLAGFLIWAIVPTGMMISRDIERTYSFSVSDVANETENIQNKAAEIEENNDSEETDGKEDENIISGFISKAKDAVEDVIINPLEEKVAQAKKMVNTVVNAIIVLVITSCVIPLFTLIAFLLLIKVTLHLDLLGEIDSVRLALVSGQKNALGKIKIKHKKS
ncbi:hypothetical protein [Blautia massiliensis (ex Durand et al. 2017)]|uniref:hypothetical protein n=1 Tax=Blautia massiliensis (ex Durand et al. 2017) TaxID=1737424 RepID=UPI0022E1D521|nr:hypothetical protein [Blautia massiliensis (ex Durand et al. 2017)]